MQTEQQCYIITFYYKILNTDALTCKQKFYVIAILYSVIFKKHIFFIQICNATLTVK